MRYQCHSCNYTGYHEVSKNEVPETVICAQCGGVSRLGEYKKFTITELSKMLSLCMIASITTGLLTVLIEVFFPFPQLKYFNIRVFIISLPCL
jgi:hypothetical protein